MLGEQRVEKYPLLGEDPCACGINAKGETKSASMALGVIHRKRNTNTKGNVWNTKKFSQGAEGP